MTEGEPGLVLGDVNSLADGVSGTFKEIRSSQCPHYEDTRRPSKVQRLARKICICWACLAGWKERFDHSQAVAQGQQRIARCA